MARLLRKLQEEPETLEIEIDACSPRCGVPKELAGKGHAARVRIRQRDGGSWLTADRTMRERRALLHHDDTAAETWSSEHVELLTTVCLEAAGRRPPAADVALLLETAERLDATHFALTTRSKGQEARTRRRSREDLLTLLLQQAWPTNALRSGIAWALPVEGEYGAEWLSLESEGAPAILRGGRTTSLDARRQYKRSTVSRESCCNAAGNGQWAAGRGATASSCYE